MATYKEIFGTNIEVLASDPANPVTGQVWYNSTSNVVKGAAVTTSGAWATGGNLNTGRPSALGGTGATKDAALAFGGGPPPAPTAVAITESYNGTAWTEVADLNTARAFVTGVGPNTDAIAAGGDQYSGVAESWNGTSWTSITNEPDASNAYGTAGSGTSNALFFGGGGAGPAATANRYWNGSTWTALATILQQRSGISGAGNSYDAALAASGQYSSTRYANVESFNGTSWTEITDVNTARGFGNGAGTQTSALIFGGDIPPVTGATEEWNGSTWTETTDLSTARSIFAKAGTGPADALAAGGSPALTATEEWTGAGSPLTVTFTDS
jgi:hypothetical protein